MSTAVAPGLTNRVKTSLPPEYEEVGQSSEPLATFLGLFSIGLGLWELAAPRAVGRAHRRPLHPRPPPGLRAARDRGRGRHPDQPPPGRVAVGPRRRRRPRPGHPRPPPTPRPGDARPPQRRAGAIAAVAGVTALDVARAAQDHTRSTPTVQTPPPRGDSMKALCWHGKGDVRCDTVPDPKIEDPRDVIIKVTSTCICGSDLHLYDMYLPDHEAGRHPRPRADGRGRRGRQRRSRSSRRATGSSSRSTSPAASAGSARSEFYSCCDTTNPNAEAAAAVMGHAPAGLYGYSHLTGGYAGGQAEYLRVVRAPRPTS